jgi:hypothetical protein
VEGGEATVTNFENLPDNEPEQYPVEPRYHPIHKIPRMIYDFLASSKLAMFLLVAILVSCVAGVTIVREARAWQLIFSTLWFNGLLVLLVVNVACCFFGRIWHRKLTVITFGMILFHLSFVAMFVAIVYNSLFSFEGSLRLTEGETLPNGQPESYDIVRHGRFFSYATLTGETTLVKMHKGFKAKGDDKRVAYVIAVGEGKSKKQDIIYITKNFDYKGIRYFPDKEGYSPLIVLADRQGKELYGAYIPLQSLRQKDGGYLYTTGTKQGTAPFNYPQEPLAKPLFDLQVTLLPSKLEERGGEVNLQVWPLKSKGSTMPEKPLAEGKVAMGPSTFDTGEYLLSFKELRYWVGMNVRYDPGKPVVLASLWVGLAGMIITTAGRMVRSRRRSS